MAMRRMFNAAVGAIGLLATGVLISLILLGSNAGNDATATYVVQAPTLSETRQRVGEVGGQIAYEGAGSAVGARLAPEQVQALQNSDVLVRPWQSASITLADWPGSGTSLSSSSDLSSGL